MLVVTRTVGEEVVIGDPSNPVGIVRVQRITGDRVRIAFEFPHDVPVNRREVADEMVAEAGGIGHQALGIRPDARFLMPGASGGRS